jgi:hypothetical protein
MLRNNSGLDRLRQARRAASERLDAAFDAHNKLTRDTPDDDAATIMAELSAAEAAVEEAAHKLEVWLDDDGPGND